MGTQFKKVTHGLLNELKQQGYNALISNNELSDPQIYWYPEEVDNVHQYIIELINRGYRAPLNQPMIMWIQDAIENLSEYELSGIVFITE
ncbi:hypothetical protein SAMN05660841_00221 [Sphingobacterium nematocida]|uniref:Uncharacterized protein n=1 Tax=Sphingobacterium nematocida TaxID=1513896 RepID=A0A1T5AWF2_9SPHI|nr:hypothetical protein [Sphingobacterium nematocida]SKB39157.1 hypothetical protein SAMN05660841_00221 [Sphingobacterium nematocida]